MILNMILNIVLNISQEINNSFLPDSECEDHGVPDGYRARHNTQHKAF